MTATVVMVVDGCLDPVGRACRRYAHKGNPRDQGDQFLVHGLVPFPFMCLHRVRESVFKKLTRNFRKYDLVYYSPMELKDTTLLSVLKKAHEKESPLVEKRAVASTLHVDSAEKDFR